MMRLAITDVRPRPAAPALGLRDLQRLLERRVGEHHHHARRLRAVAPLGGLLALRALRARLHRRHRVERVEQRLGLVAAAAGPERRELRLERHRVAHERVVLDPRRAVVVGRLEVAVAHHLAAPVAHRRGVVRVARLSESTNTSMLRTSASRIGCMLPDTSTRKTMSATPLVFGARRRGGGAAVSGAAATGAGGSGVPFGSAAGGAASAAGDVDGSASGAASAAATAPA
jgi:hypothetical protein